MYYSILGSDFNSKEPKIKYEEDKVSIYLPGVGKDNIDIIEDQKFITITYKQNDKDEKIKFEKMESFDTTAEYKDGILYLYITINEKDIKKIKIK